MSFYVITFAPRDWLDIWIIISDIEVYFYPAAEGLLILIVALWSRVTLIISMLRICVSNSLYYFLLVVDMETVAPLLVLLVLPGDDVFELCPWAAGLD